MCGGVQHWKTVPRFSCPEVETARVELRFRKTGGDCPGAMKVHRLERFELVKGAQPFAAAKWFLPT